MKWFLLYGISGISLLLNIWAIDSTYGDYREFAGLGIFLSFISIALVAINQVAIKISTYLINADRAKITLFFKPLLYASQFTSIAITLSCGFAITTMSFFVPALLTGYYLPKITFFIALGAIYASFKVVKVIISARPKPTLNVMGIAIGRSEAPLLWKSVDSISKDLNTNSPERIIFTMDDNICVTEALVKVKDSIYTGRTLILSLPLMKCLSKEQSLAVIAHEIAHFSGEDTKFSIKFFPIFHDTRKSIEEVGNAISQFGATGIAALPALAMLNHFLESFALIESEISRQCEKEADLKAANLVGHQNMIEALALTHYLSLAWANCDNALYELLREEGKIANNIMSVFPRFIERDQVVNNVFKLINSHTTHPFHSHPSLQYRIEYLGETVNILKQASDWLATDNNILVSEVKDLASLESILTEEKNKMLQLMHEYVRIIKEQEAKQKQAA